MSTLATLERPSYPAITRDESSGAALVFFAADTSSEEFLPLSLVYPGCETGAGVSRMRIELERGARARLVLRYGTAGILPEAQPEGSKHTGGNSSDGAIMGGGSTLPVFRTALDIRLDADARLELFVVSALPRGLGREAVDTAILGDRASLVWTEAGFDEGEGRYELGVDLSGKASELDFAGAYGAAGKTDRLHVLNERHGAPGARSRAVMKSALRDSARLCFRGLIHVEPGAPGTDAYLSNRNLILDDGARAESLPQLRIETDDVACSHGSATGGPREDEMFYLMSRGLDRDSARRLLVLGHLGSVLDRAPPDLAGELEDLAARALGGAAGAEAGAGVRP
ncbi:MAG: SufD family Fe-S cluster assembly protein [Spirochaetia bacterium]|nr:SufD family Fe-S cluster assembly protein [Spirochaetia bacterium]